jgi:hypothetical protein
MYKMKIKELDGGIVCDFSKFQGTVDLCNFNRV